MNLLRALHERPGGPATRYVGASLTCPRGLSGSQPSVQAFQPDSGNTVNLHLTWKRWRARVSGHMLTLPALSSLLHGWEEAGHWNLSRESASSAHWHFSHEKVSSLLAALGCVCKANGARTKVCVPWLSSISLLLAIKCNKHVSSNCAFSYVSMRWHLHCVHSARQHPCHWGCYSHLCDWLQIVKSYLATIDVNKLSSLTVSKLLSSSTTFGLLGNSNMHALHGNIWEEAMKVAVRGKMAWVQFPSYTEMLQDLLKAHKLLYGNTPFSLKFAFEMVHECTAAELLQAGQQAKLAQLQNNPVFTRDLLILARRLYRKWQKSTSSAGAPISRKLLRLHWPMMAMAIVKGTPLKEALKDKVLSRALTLNIINSIVYANEKLILSNVITKVIEHLGKGALQVRPAQSINRSLVDANPSWVNWVNNLAKILMADWTNNPIDQEEEFSNPYLTKQYGDPAPQDPCKGPVPTAQRFVCYKCKIANKPIAIKDYTVLNRPVISEISSCVELITWASPTNYKWWTCGLLTKSNRSLPALGNHKHVNNHVPLGALDGEGCKVTTCIVQSSKILKAQQATLVALVLSWNSHHYYTWTPSVFIEDTNTICRGDISCYSTPCQRKAQIVPHATWEGQVNCLAKVGNIIWLPKNSVNWSAC